MRALLVLALALVAANPARAGVDTPAAENPAPLDVASLEDHRGGIQTTLGLEIGFGASVKTYVDGSLALETTLTWTPEGVQTQRVFESAQVAALRGSGAAPAADQPVSVAAGTQVIHDLSRDRIASVVLNTANDRVIRQETDLSLHLPQLPDIQHQLALERLGQGLQGLSPAATGLAP